MGVHNLLPYNKFSWGNGLGIMFIREREALWMAFLDTKYGSMWGGWCSNVVHENKGWGYGRILRRAGRSFFVILDLRSVMTLKLDFGMTCSMKIKSSR